MSRTHEADHGSQDAPFWVLGMPGIPAVLVETAFLSSAADAARLVTPAFQGLLAASVADGLLGFLGAGAGAAAVTPPAVPAPAAPPAVPVPGPAIAPAGGTQVAPQDGAQLNANPQTRTAQVSITLAPGDTLWAIAARYGTTVGTLVSLNGLSSPDSIKAGQTIVLLPGTQLLAGQSPTQKLPASITVAPGDTLSGIAATYGLSVDDLTRLNNLSSADSVEAGQTLQLTAQPSAPSASGTHAASSSTVTVQPGDTLSGLAARLGVTLQDLVLKNNLPSPDAIQAGQSLLVPG